MCEAFCKQQSRSATVLSRQQRLQLPACDKNAVQIIVKSRVGHTITFNTSSVNFIPKTTFIRSAVLTQLTSVTDRQTDGRTDIQT